MPTVPTVPTYAELPRPDETGLPLAWGVWGAEDQLGTLNHITPERVAAAARLVHRGVRFNLDLPLHLPLGLINPGAHHRRSAPRHTLFSGELAGLTVRDDKLDDFFLQASTQWDGLTHIGDPRLGFYNGVQDAQVTGEEGTRNGIENMAAFGIAGRGVLADLPRHFRAAGRDWHPHRGEVAGARDLEECLGAQGVSLQPGDILLVRQGWLALYRETDDLEARDALFRRRTYSGLAGGEELWKFLWDHQVAALASDTVTVEVFPPVEGRPCLHWAIPRLGLVLGELFDLEALAEDCVREGDYRCFFTSSPLNLRGGVGSPPNAMAIR
jgi:hypothetical protein